MTNDAARRGLQDRSKTHIDAPHEVECRGRELTPRRFATRSDPSPVLDREARPHPQPTIAGRLENSMPAPEPTSSRHTMSFRARGDTGGW